MIGSRRAVLYGAFILCMGSLLVRPAFALGEKSHVTSTPQAGSFALVERRTPATIFVDPAEWPGVLHAATNFASDVQQITGDWVHSVDFEQGVPSDQITGALQTFGLIA